MITQKRPSIREGFLYCDPIFHKFITPHVGGLGDSHR